ncbi:MAG: hypothetical protein FWF29_02240 [Treponema sp.]|nr:hypothetical protein [Treponema sp.]
MPQQPRIKTWFPKLSQYQKQLGLEPKGAAQKLIDSEIVRLSDPYVPSDTTYTRKSVYLHTDFGSGKVIYEAYGNAPGRNIWNDEKAQFQDRPRRGPFWVLRMWADGGMEKIMKTVNRLFGGN